jgi:hypothetical protein
MNEDFLVMGAIFIGLLVVMTKTSQAATGNGSGVGMPTIGTNGNILTADKQYLYDGKIWRVLGPDGYEVIPGQ